MKYEKTLCTVRCTTALKHARDVSGMQVIYQGGVLSAEGFKFNTIKEWDAPYNFKIKDVNMFTALQTAKKPIVPISSAIISSKILQKLYNNKLGV